MIWVLLPGVAVGLSLGCAGVFGFVCDFVVGVVISVFGVFIEIDVI